MRLTRIFILTTLLSFAGSPLFAADAITSDAPSLPDFGAGLSPDLTLPGLELPDLLPQATPAASNATAAPADTTSTAPAAAPAVPAAPTATAVPPAAVPDATTPIASPTEALPVAAEVASPTAVPTEAVAPAPAAAPAEVDLTALKGIEAYFPMKAGLKWEYRSSMAQVRTVECMSRDTQSTGVSGVFQVTTGGTPLSQTWKKAGGKIVLASKLANLPIGWVRLVEPQGKTIPRWLFDRGNGTGSYYKQEVGPVTAGGKKYADGLTVTERTLKAGVQVSLRKWFYAKGVGLVAEAAYNLKGEPLADQTFELQTAP